MFHICANVLSKPVVCFDENVKKTKQTKIQIHNFPEGPSFYNPLDKATQALE